MPNDRWEVKDCTHVVGPSDDLSSICDAHCIAEAFALHGQGSRADADRRTLISINAFADACPECPCDVPHAMLGQQDKTFSII